MQLESLGITAASLVAGAVLKKALGRNPNARRWVGIGTAALALAGTQGANAAGLIETAYMGEGGIAGLLAVGIHSATKNARQSLRDVRQRKRRDPNG